MRSWSTSSSPDRPAQGGSQLTAGTLQFAATLIDLPRRGQIGDLVPPSASAANSSCAAVYCAWMSSADAPGVTRVVTTPGISISLVVLATESTSSGRPATTPADRRRPVRYRRPRRIRLSPRPMRAGPRSARPLRRGLFDLPQQILGQGDRGQLLHNLVPLAQRGIDLRELGGQSLGLVTAGQVARRGTARSRRAAGRRQEPDRPARRRRRPRR